MSDTIPLCPKCESPYAYSDGTLLICPECANEWNPNEVVVDPDAIILNDAVGNLLAEGDKVTLIKDLKVKAVINRFVAGDHDIDCKVDGNGQMMLKSKFVKKQN